jgi:hypothetical protein
MVNIVLLAASCILEPCHQQQRNLMRRRQHARPLQGSPNRVGWISRKNLFRSRRSFFLDISFYSSTQHLAREREFSIQLLCAFEIVDDFVAARAHDFNKL